MIDNASISPVKLLTPNLRVVPKISRLRDQVDRKRTYFLAKRLFDIVFASLFILFALSWLFPILALLIKLSSRGPVFFTQKRIGRGGKTFICYKLRTMVANAEADILPALENDNRITALGCFLRKSNIDEFPQFFNILKGDMSLVGPRPHMYADCKKFSSIVPNYKSRTLVKPGLTGLAQLKGYHGPATTSDSVRMRYLWDNYYISNIGFMMDLRIGINTVFQKFKASGKQVQETFRINGNTGQTIHN
jgi:putative colanic acid biosynthesis UDP-glucose lipid carrier transferase